MQPQTDRSANEADNHNQSCLAFFHFGSHLRLWTVAAIALALDLWSKAWAFENLAPNDVMHAIPNILTFRRSVNAGALFGMGKGFVSFFIVASVIALAFVMYLFATSASNRRSMHLGLSFVLAGSLGNLYDRTFIIADHINLATHTETVVGKVLDNDPDSEFIEIGVAPDGAMPKQFRRENVKYKPIGVVRDFLKFEPQVAGYDVWPWVFNIADSLLVVGVGILMLNFWWEHKEAKRAQAAASQALET